MALPPLDRTNYSDFLIEAISAAVLPKFTSKRISGNKVAITFEKKNAVYRYRLLLFAVGGSGRGKSLERRVEITSTYAGNNLDSLDGFKDLIIGVDRNGRNLVGIDARRLNYGGKSHNASTFVYLPAFDRLKSTNYFIYANDRQNLFNKEYQIYFKTEFIGSYLTESSSLHASGLRQTPQVEVQDSLSDGLEEFAAFGSKQKLTYEQQVELSLKKMEIGRAGEAFVLEQERAKLRAAGRPDLADKIDWISQTQPYVGYDIKSFNQNGTAEFIEVKSSSGHLKTFFFTDNEYRQSKKLLKRYRIECVSYALKAASVHSIINPAQKISDGVLSMCAITYRINV